MGSLFALVLVAAPHCVQIVATNDLHGHMVSEAHSTKAAAGQKSLSVDQGGLPALGGYLDILRKKYPKQLVLLDAGDLFQGTVPSNLSKGAAVIAAYDTLGYQAAALGNHEFDFGADEDPNDLLGSIKRRVSEAHFPFLAANVYDAKSGARPAWKNLKPSVLLDVNHVKVGVIGATTPDTPTVTVPQFVASLQFRDPAKDVAEQAAALRKQGAQLVVLVAHIGGECTDLKNPDDTSSCNKQSEMFKLLDAMPKGTVDVAIAGHTHKYIAQNYDGAAVAEAGSYSASFDWLESCVANGRVTTTIHQPVDVCTSVWAEGGCRPREASTGTAPATFLGETVKPDAAVEKTLDPFIAKVKAQQEAPIGVTMAAQATRRHDAPSPLGLLVAQGIRSGVPRADVGLTNAGGVRADLPAGALTFGQVFEVLPFDNRVVGLTLTGAQLQALLIAPLVAGHGFPQLANAKLDFNRAHPEKSTLTVAGAPVDPKREYLLATNDFLANGGDGTKDVMATVAPDKRHDTGELVRDSFLAFLKSQPEPVQVPQP